MHLSLAQHVAEFGGQTGALMRSAVAKRSVVIDGHKTSVSLEDAFWGELKKIARFQRVPLNILVARIDAARKQTNLSSAIRLFVLEHFQNGARPTVIPPVGSDESQSTPV